jgi:hypothetical protein
MGSFQAWRHVATALAFRTFLTPRMIRSPPYNDWRLEFSTCVRYTVPKQNRPVPNWPRRTLRRCFGQICVSQLYSSTFHLTYSRVASKCAVIRRPSSQQYHPTIYTTQFQLSPALPNIVTMIASSRRMMSVRTKAMYIHRQSTMLHEPDGHHEMLVQLSQRYPE